MSGQKGPKIIMFIEDQRTTPFSPTVTEQLDRLKTLHTQTTKMIDKIRFMAQTNPLFRGERLVPSALSLVGDRSEYAAVLKEASINCYDNMRPLFEHMDQLASGMHAIANCQDVYLRQVQIFVVNPMRDFVNVTYPRIQEEYAELEKRRDKYDIARGRKAANLEQAQQELIEQATLVENSLVIQSSEHQMAFAKAIDTFVRAEAQLFKEMKGVIDGIKGADNKKRWQPPAEDKKST